MGPHYLPTRHVAVQVLHPLGRPKTRATPRRYLGQEFNETRNAINQGGACAEFFLAIASSEAASECPTVLLAVQCAELNIEPVQELFQGCSVPCPSATSQAELFLEEAQTLAAKVGMCVDVVTIYWQRFLFVIGFDGFRCLASYEEMGIPLAGEWWRGWVEVAWGGLGMGGLRLAA